MSPPPRRKAVFIPAGGGGGAASPPSGPAPIGPPWAPSGPPGSSPQPPTGPGGGPTPSYPILTEEVGYPPSPLANTGSTSPRTGGTGHGASFGPVVSRALQDVLGWKIKADDAKGFVGALKQSFDLTMVEGAVVGKWKRPSYAVQTDLSGGLTGAQLSIYTMANTLLDQALPLIDGLTALDPAANAEDVFAMKDLVRNQLTNLTSEIGYLGGPRVMRVQQYFQMLLGVRLTLYDPTATPMLHVTSLTPTSGSPLAMAFPPPYNAANPWPPDVVASAETWQRLAQPWTNPDYVQGSLGDLRDELGLNSTPVPPPGAPVPAGSVSVPNYINTVADETDATNFRIVVDYVNSLLNVWSNSIQFFAGTTSPFLGTQLVIISRQLGVISETVNEVRFVLDSVFIGPSLRATTQLVFQNLPHVINSVDTPTAVRHLPPIYLEDLLLWTENFVGDEAQDAIQNGGKLGLGEDFITMIYQLCTQAYGLYLYAQTQGSAISTIRVQQSLYKLTTQLWDLYNFASPVSLPYIAPRP